MLRWGGRYCPAAMLLLQGFSVCINAAHSQVKKKTLFFLSTTVTAGITVREAPVGAEVPLACWGVSVFNQISKGWRADKFRAWLLLWFSKCISANTSLSKSIREQRAVKTKGRESLAGWSGHCVVHMITQL